MIAVVGLAADRWEGQHALARRQCERGFRRRHRSRPPFLRFCFRHRNGVSLAGLAERWPSRLVATVAAEDRLNVLLTRIMFAGATPYTNPQIE